MLEANPADLEIGDGVISVRGTPSVELSLAELARIVTEEPDRLPDGADNELDGDAAASTAARAAGRAARTAATSRSTSRPASSTIDRYVVVEDCGVPVNPAIVEGQIRGGVAQGIGAVLLEHAAYGEDGQFLAATFMDYLMPTTMVVPNFEIHHVETVAHRPRRELPGRRRGRDDRGARVHHATPSRTRSRRSGSRCANSTCRRRGSSSSLGTVPA